MPARQMPERFLVAFSFAGEQRDLVRTIVEAVEQRLGAPNVFFDEWYEHYLAGDDADLTLQEIYGRRCVLAVVCVSARYEGKPWTRAEHAAIRARQMRARDLDDASARLGMLPIRVGEGEVEGILFNTIAPDARSRTAAQVADLIVDRLRLLVPELDARREARDWPDVAPPLHWPMADHRDARAAFETLLTRTAPWRLLPLRGPSESGKSHISRQMLGNALRIPDLACGRFDFKGTTDMDAEVRAFVQQLDVPLPPAAARLTERLSHVLDSLKGRASPALLILDTYEAAGDAADWVEKQLLPTLIRARWLRVVITGQRVPEKSGAPWESESSDVITLRPPPPPDWFEYGRRHRPDLTLADVQTACRLAADKASLLAQLLGPGAV